MGEDNCSDWLASIVHFSIIFASNTGSVIQQIRCNWLTNPKTKEATC